MKSKSAETKVLLAWLVSQTVLFGAMTLGNIAANSGYSGNLDDVLISLSGPTSQVLWVLFAYLYGAKLFKKERKWVVGSLIPIALGVAAYSASGGAAGDFAEQTSAGLMQIWGMVVFLRKWRATRLEKKTVYSAGYVFFPLFFFVIVLVNLLQPVLVSLGVAGIQQVIFTFSMVALPILMGLLFLQFTPESSSLEVKFMGVGLLVVIIAVQIEVSSHNTTPHLWETYDVAPDRQSLLVTPDSTGDYTVQSVPYRFHNVEGESLTAADDTTIARSTAFPVTLYGVTTDSIWINSNGALAVAALPDSADGSLFLHRIQVPAVAAFRTDQDPSESGRIIYTSTSDSLVVSWLEVPLFWDEIQDGRWPREDRLFNSQIVIRRDGSITLNRGDLGVRPQFWETGLTPGMDSDMISGFTGPGWRGTAGTLSEGMQYPVSRTAVEPIWIAESNLARRVGFQHDQSRKSVWFALWMFLAVLVMVPVYFRISLRSRLERLMSALDRVTAGDLGADVEVTVRDEIGRMSESFNSMTGSLREYSTRMEDLVEERTAELKATQAQLVEQEKLASLGSLTAGIAHEIKNPLNFVNNFAEVGAEMADELSEAIAEGRTEEAQAIIAELRENATQITKHGRRADEIVKAMMQHARGGASEMETVELNSFLEEYANLAWHGMRAKDNTFQAELVRDFAGEVGEIKAMPQELGRVILNLLNNAFDAVCGVEGAQITIATRATDTGVSISVSDNGPGIPQAIREKIFEPFFTTKPTGEGTGLGLSLSYDIITKGHGGAMTVETTTNGGAMFTINLPLRK